METKKSNYRSVILHIGAHKTGTTYIQEAFESNRKHMFDLGINYISMREFREWRNRAQNHLRSGVQLDIIKDDFFKSIRIENCDNSKIDLIISDENIIGTCEQIVKTGNIYPELVKKSKLIAKILEHEKLYIVFSVREYSSFISSVYVEAIRNGFHLRFSDFIKSFQPERRGWDVVIDDILKSFNSASLFVYKYENFKDDDKILFSKIKNLLRRDVSIDSSHKVVRPSLSNFSVNTLIFLKNYLHTKNFIKIVELLVILESYIKVGRKFSPFSSSDKEMYRKLYECHIEKISKMNNIIFWRPKD